jgi:hypothetical protein
MSNAAVECFALYADMSNAAVECFALYADGLDEMNKGLIYK